MDPNNDFVILDWTRADAERFKLERGRKIGSFDAVVRDNQIFIGSRLLVPVEDRVALIKQYWEDPKTTGGRDRLFARISEKYVGISRRYIMDTLKTFESWKQRQPVRTRRIIKPIITTAPNQLWQMDILTLSGPLEWNGFRYVFVVIDCFSKYVWAWPLVNRDAASIVEKLQELLSTYKPMKISSDNGTEFKNQFVKALLDHYGVIHEMGLPYVPQVHGQVERTNRTIRDIISKLYLEGKRDWPSMIPDIVENIRTAENKTTKMRPVDLFMGPRDLNQDRDVIERNIQRAKSLTTPAPKFRQGEIVRIANPSTTRKGIHPIRRWGTRDFTIERVIYPVNPWEQEQYLLNNGRIYTGYDLQRSKNV